MWPYSSLFSPDYGKIEPFYGCYLVLQHTNINQIVWVYMYVYSTIVFSASLVDCTGLY